eukprot:TRINITY_DN49217_c0_g1_i1.p1 TRINITY_DN49217_c0_g1~~TRINITY_DN49217_c0_g1_i1.p1  ORF type:complete len:340 (+),score=44.00 TRINITY_DN49217_c0_g1_i1:82-1101(+)
MLCPCRWDDDTDCTRAVENLTVGSWPAFPEVCHPGRDHTQENLRFAEDAFYAEIARQTTLVDDEGDQQGEVSPAHPSLPPRYWPGQTSQENTGTNISALEQTLAPRATFKVGESDLHPTAPVRGCAGDEAVTSVPVFNEEDSIPEERCGPSSSAAAAWKRANEITDFGNLLSALNAGVVFDFGGPGTQVSDQVGWVYEASRDVDDASRKRRSSSSPPCNYRDTLHVMSEYGDMPPAQLPRRHGGRSCIANTDDSLSRSGSAPPYMECPTPPLWPMPGEVAIRGFHVDAHGRRRQNKIVSGGSPATAGRPPVAAKLRPSSLTRQYDSDRTFKDCGVDFQL